jgi:hypothetical protein
MEIGLLVVIAAVIAGGVLGSTLRAWSISSRLFSLEDRLDTLERAHLREVKSRVSMERWGKKTKDEALVEAALETPVAPIHTQPPWWTRFPKSTAG